MITRNYGALQSSNTLAERKFELIQYFYIQLLGSDWFSDITLFVNITLFGNDGV
jgi:hypothetical protein